MVIVLVDVETILATVVRAPNMPNVYTEVIVETLN